MSNFDFMVDGQPAEAPLAAASQDYAATPPSYGDAFSAMFQQGSTGGMLQRWQERAAYQPGVSGTLGRAFANLAAADAGAPPVYDQDLSPIPSPLLSADEANTKYAPLGADGKPAKITEAPIPDALAQMIGKAKADEIQRDGVISRFENSSSLPVTFGTGAVAFMLDPVNAASAFIPGFGEETVAARLGGGLLGRTAGRLVEGATGGALAQAPLSALRYGLGQEEASDYGLRDAFRDVLFGAAGNAVLHAGLGGAGDLLGRSEEAALTSAETTPQPTAFSGRGATIANSDAATKYDAIRASIGQMVDGRAIDVDSVFDYRPPNAETAIGLVQRGLPSRPDITNIEPSVAEQARRLEPELFQRYDGLAAQQQKLRTVIADPEAALGGPLDAEIQGLREQALQSRGAERRDLLTQIAAKEEARPTTLQDAAVEARRQLQQADYAMRDLAPQVTSAVERAKPLVEMNAVNKTVEMGPRPRLSLKDIGAIQAQLYRDGFAPGISDNDFHALDEAIYAPKPEVTAVEPAPQTKTESPSETPSGPSLSENEMASLSPDERSELEASDTALQAANDHASAYEEAGSCLKAAE